MAIFAAVGLLFPGAATLLTFAANRALGPVITGTLGNLAPLFAVARALRWRTAAGRCIRRPGAIAPALDPAPSPHEACGDWRIWRDAPFAAALASYIVSAIVVVDGRG